jgi:hypothetical protein
MSRSLTLLIPATMVAVVVVACRPSRETERAEQAPPVSAPSATPATPSSPPLPTDAPLSDVQRTAALPTPETLAADKAAEDQFMKDVAAFIEIHRRVAKEQPKVSDNATIEEIDRHQRGFLQALAAARPQAKRGDLFKPDFETAIRRLLVKVFEGVEGRQLRDSIMDENPTGITIRVNGRYPDQVPMATMPPDVLAALPKLPEELEYRFVGDALALLDVPAHLIVDFIPAALPKN